MKNIDFLDNYKDNLNFKYVLHNAKSVEIGALTRAIHRSQFPMW